MKATITRIISDYHMIPMNKCNYKNVHAQCNWFSLTLLDGSEQFFPNF